MASYRELLKQREELQRQIEAAREQEVAAAISRVREVVAEYGLTPEQVFSRSSAKYGPKPGTRPAKYRDPASGATWGGMGREPLWIKGQPREQFLINP
ncbi:H-NS histone family protein [Paraburkholderia ginsengisoli]|uniref:H-NS histone family protein n=1 Tax=Paraburkholderia ginsengisoli TaxID=311231 RepID=A0A7T4N338_9BURK|nr:H-NS histone family protein [Paraburkholderia ginsengisoli]QQC64360.1 H-NS histone family protein [Paraburkholderia ginsengisoli]